MELRIKITGELPLPVNAVAMAQLILAVDQKIDELRKFLGDNGGGMVDECWPVTPRKRKASLPLLDGMDKPLPPPDDPFHIPQFLKGGAA